MIQYVTDKYKWVLIPQNSAMTEENYRYGYIIKSTSNLLFINNVDFGKINNESMCRKLIEEDKILFNEFHDSCSIEDRDEGMVSLEDDYVYGLFDDNKIVAVSSLWNWGNVISDIGILVHPEYRNKGYAKTVCQTLMISIDKKFVWRSNEANKASYRLAVSIGFIHYGLIQELENHHRTNM